MVVRLSERENYNSPAMGNQYYQRGFGKVGQLDGLPAKKRTGDLKNHIERDRVLGYTCEKYYEGERRFEKQW